MFTGIVEAMGKVVSLEKKGSNIQLGIAASFAKELKIGQSVAHNGICLTVETKAKGHYVVTAVKETLDKTNLGSLKKGDSVNLERCLRVGDRLDGHFVQGHVDTTAKCVEIKREKGSWLFKFQVPSFKSKNSSLIVDKGSICINGVSLTVVETVQPETRNLNLLFSVAIIPHTFTNTNFSSLKKGDLVNIEFDILGKYIQKNIPIGIGAK